MIVVAAFFSGRWQQRCQLSDQARDVETREKKLALEKMLLLRDRAYFDIEHEALIANWLKFRRATGKFNSTKNATANHCMEKRID